ncbi:MAG: SusC/RagA family TonB-linked outer membrane protein, partial [Saprospiraceae bacterium]|nr:SusC/RagA family TonB-linked outer membrane protein [Saprospiraceae bacterium]
MERIALLCTFFLLFAATTTMAQRTVSGNVMDEDGEPLIGATVQVKGTTVGAVTDIDGSYSLTVPAGRETLVFSYTGFRSVEVELGASDVVDITLASDIAQLSEVVVVGYGTQIKSTLTGNVASVEGEEIENLPVTSVEQALQGRTAGVFIQSVNGKPGGRINVRVRGSSSITASNQPLYVIDGVPITSGTFSSPGAGSQNFLADFNFNDVESVEILKDASASAIYGSRAANGVILITTKKGKVGKARVNFNYSRGFSDESGRRQFLNADEYIDLFRRTARGGAAYDWANQLDGFGLGSDYTEENNEQAYLDFVEGRFDRYSGPSEWRERETNTDWQDEAFRNGDSQTADFSISGGSEDLRYFGSLGYSEQDGILFGNDFTRFSGRLNLNGKVNERMSWGMTSSLSRTSNNRVSNDNFFSTPLQLVALSPLTPPRNTTDQVFRGFEPGQLFDRPVTTYYNGLIEEVNSRKETVTYRSLANFYSSYEFFQGFSLRGEFGVDLANIRQNRFQGRMTTAGESTNGFADSRWSEILNFNTKLFANFNREFGGVNNVDIVAGVEFQKSKSENVEVDAQEFPLDDLKTIASAADIIGGLGDLTQFSFLSYFARFNYNYKRKYLLTLSGRVDASSRFGMNNQYGFFPAIAAGYVISEEPFFASQAISFLKVRASWGQTGNASIGNFSSLGLFGAEGYAQQSGLQPIQIPNPNLTWEETQQLD